MRIDSPKGKKSDLQGTFTGRFIGIADTASFMTSADFGRSLDQAIDDPGNAGVIEKLRASGRLIVSGGIRITTGSVELDSGSVRIEKAILEYLDDEDALQFRFIGEIPPMPPPPSGSPVPPSPTPPSPSTFNLGSDFSIDYYRDGRY